MKGKLLYNGLLFAVGMSSSRWGTGGCMFLVCMSLKLTTHLQIRRLDCLAHPCIAIQWNICLLKFAA